MKNIGALKIVWILLIAMCVSLVVSAFLPLISVNDDIRDMYSEKELKQEAEDGITLKEMMDVSIFEYGTKIAPLETDEDEAGIYQTVSWAFVLLAVVSVVFAVFKKPILTIISALLTVIPFFLYWFDLNDRGTIGTPNSAYNWGVGYTLYYVILVAVVVCAIVFLIVKHNNKVMTNFTQFEFQPTTVPEDFNTQNKEQ